MQPPHQGHHGVHQELHLSKSHSKHNFTEKFVGLTGLFRDYSSKKLSSVNFFAKKLVKKVLVLWE
jgi:hypothetical protein